MVTIRQITKIEGLYKRAQAAPQIEFDLHGSLGPYRTSYEFFLKRVLDFSTYVSVNTFSADDFESKLTWAYVFKLCNAIDKELRQYE